MVKNRTNVNQPYGEMLKFVKSMPKGSKACVPKIRKIINGVQGGRFSKGECHDGKVEGEKGEGKHSCNHLVFCYRARKDSYRSEACPENHKEDPAPDPLLVLREAQGCSLLGKQKV